MVQSIFESANQLLGLWFTVAFFVVGGVVFLKYGADSLVNGASNIGLRIGLSTTMTGLTIVAFGTSAPELVVSVLTAVKGQPEICLGNVVGSNIANSALILGGTAIVTPLLVPTKTIRVELFLCFFAILAVWIFAMTGRVLGRFEGVLLLLVFVIWIGSLIRSASRTSATTKALGIAAGDGVAFHSRALIIDIVLVVAGLVGLVLGADALVVGAVATAHELNVPDVVVGLTVVAGGTSLPEFAVCLVAAFKHQADITLGNILGSNIFNALLILGVCCVIQPISFSAAGAQDTLRIDIPVCIAISGFLIYLLMRNKVLRRAHGVILVSLYVIYIAWLVIRNF